MIYLKRILQVGLTNNLGGIEMMVMNIYKNIDRNKIQFDFIKYSEGLYYEDEIKKMGGKIIELPTRRESYLKNKKMIKELMKSGEYDAVHINCLSVANIDFAKYAIKYKKTKVILHSHQDMKLRHLKSEILHRYNRLWLQNKDIIRLACSKKAANWIHGKKVTANNKVIIIQNAIELEKFKYNFEVQEKYKKELGIKDKFVIGCIGRFAYQKNYEFLAKIFYEIKKLEKNSVLICVGGEGGMQQEIINKFKELNLLNDVKFLGIRKDVDKIIQIFDAFVLPSRWEGLGIVYIEAQAAGVMTFASDVVPEEANVTDLMNYISLNRSPEYWAKCILNKSKNYLKKDTIKTIKEKGYDIQEVANKMQKIYLEI